MSICFINKMFKNYLEFPLVKVLCSIMHKHLKCNKIEQKALIYF